eukprot:321580-Rhodomonas_salina.1
MRRGRGGGSGGGGIVWSRVSQLEGQKATGKGHRQVCLVRQSATQRWGGSLREEGREGGRRWN